MRKIRHEIDNERQGFCGDSRWLGKDVSGLKNGKNSGRCIFLFPPQTARKQTRSEWVEEEERVLVEGRRIETTYIIEVLL